MTPATPLLLTDDDVRRLRPEVAVAAMSQATALAHAGRLVTPARVAADLGAGRLTVTAGADDEWFGYRVYDTMPTRAGEQTVVLHERASGRVAAIAVGNLLGQYRTGALGGVAMQELAPRGGVRVAVIGAGAQAWAQLWAASGVLDVEAVTVVSRTAASRGAFAGRARAELGLACEATELARDAVREADVVILATSSGEPVLETSWLPQECLVITLGPKQVGRAEFSADLLDDAFLVTDSPAQLRAYAPPALAADADVVALGAVVAGEARAPRTGRRVYLSVGLAGTEPLLLAALLREGV